MLRKRSRIKRLSHTAQAIYDILEKQTIAIEYRLAVVKSLEWQELRLKKYEENLGNDGLDHKTWFLDPGVALVASSIKITD